MKFVILLCAFIAAATAAPMNPKLAADFRDFFVALPIDKIRRLATDHLENDPEFEAAVKYFQSKEWKTISKNLLTKPSVKEARLIVKEAGLDLEFWEMLLENFLDTLYIVVPKDQKRSFAKFINELNEIMPWEKLMDLLSDKLENSEAFKAFFEAISSERMHELVDKILRSEEYRVLSKEITEMDVPVETIVETAYTILGWKNTVAQNDLDN